LHLLTVAPAPSPAPAAGSPPAPEVCPWPGDRAWVYSITFDEALADLHRFVVPILERHGVPGHVEVVVGQIGEVRHVGQSSYNGMRQMGREELRDLLARGWGVGNHSWSHGAVTAETADLEVGRAKAVLEETVGAPVTVYCAPGSNANMNEGALDACRRYGYLGAMGITDALNRPDAADLLWVNRTFLHDQGYPPFFSAFDPYRNLPYARRERGWVIDYLHCPLETAVHPNKDCSAAQLRERIETVVGEGGDDVWLAPVEGPLAYRYLLRQTRVEPHPAGGFRISAPDLPAAVTPRVVTLALPPGTARATADGAPVPLQRRRGRPLCDVDVSAPRHLTLA
jgi:peptidoglycan/xylan/chitin deacetylase (PgdA/CDA1 family)